MNGTDTIQRARAAVPPPVPVVRRLPVGAEVQPGGGVHFRVWAPRRRRVDVVFETGEARETGEEVALAAEGDGYFSGLVPGARAGGLYRFRLDGEGPFPDPASRFQPAGPHGPSEVIDPAAFVWSDAAWSGVRCEDRVIYEIHIGSFTRTGTWAAAADHLEELADLGVTVLEVMPVAEFPGRFGWGYDGVDLFAPTRLYGRPDDFRRFVDRAHAVGLAVVLDVVYNHLGPDGNYLTQYAEEYFTDRYINDWGAAINFDGPGSGPVRDFFVANAGSWIDEFHLDGLRLDATQDVKDASPEHVLAAVSRRARSLAGGRSFFLVGENEPQDVFLLRSPEEGGCGLDALWNDDFHHSAMVALTGRNEAYYSDYRGTPQELLSAVKHGFLYQGQRYSWQKQRRGTAALGLPRSAFVNFIQNHDQVANSARGLRCHELAGPAPTRALTALLLLAPGPPMLFQGQEFQASSPFLYFADHEPELARAVRLGRLEFLSQFPSLARPDVQEGVPDPADPATFESCRLDREERLTGPHAQAWDLHRDLLRLRREDPVLAGRGAWGFDGAVLGREALVLRFFAARDATEPAGDRLLLVNLGVDLDLTPAPEPLLAPPAGMRWRLLWSSEDPRYGGSGAPEPDDEETGWQIAGRAALLLHPVSRDVGAGLAPSRAGASPAPTPGPEGRAPARAEETTT